MRTEFEMEQLELDIIMNACKSVSMIMLQCGTPSSPQENANTAWKLLAEKKGFVWDTVQPVSGKSNLFFTAEKNVSV